MLAQALAPYAANGLIVRLLNGGTHLLIGVREDPDDTLLATRAREAGFAMHALTRSRNRSPRRRGLLKGFTKIRNQAEAERLIAELIPPYRRERLEMNRIDPWLQIVSGLHGHIRFAPLPNRNPAVHGTRERCSPITHSMANASSIRRIEWQPTCTILVSRSDSTLGRYEDQTWRPA
ncbi:hypothetical protein PPGU19_061680 (plasmid) [Paraburkholderia sp. PGU19]|uniref:hypothetical protein n=1 Tax=Paraburkholderia sp. PGU19 TaxID=2735434 RepID=UPI0015DC0A94|nr:hypothetical protein [Paraburkholderia sp. PGU19]BCG01600.1 hypothetical protein PPGU19_061680 [Paraburkholderia sp. PGU19]